MAFVMQQMRTIIERFPDSGDGFRREIEAIEANVETNPHICLGLARGLLESCCKTIQAERGEAINSNEGLPARAKREIDRIQLGFDGHPDAPAIEMHLTALATGLNDAVAALSRLSNIQGLRHGGAANWANATKRHAALLASAADALSAFLFECHREELHKADEAVLRYEDEPEFNTSLDEQWPVEIATYRYDASEVLFFLDPDAYKAELAGWKASHAEQPAEGEAQ